MSSAGQYGERTHTSEVPMRYRVYGVDKVTREPREPLLLEADTEAAARERAGELGMTAESVEAVQPRTEPTPRPQARRAWGLLVPVALAVGIGIGTVVPRVSVVGPAPPTAAPAVAKGLRLERVTAAEELFALAGDRAVVFQYAGGDVDFWVELETRDGQQSLGGPREAWGVNKSPGPGQTVEGYLVWARGAADEQGRELWRVGWRRDLVTARTSAAGAATPLGQASVSTSREERQSTSGMESGPVQVWRGQRPGLGVTAVSGTSTLETSALPAPLPAGRDVCVAEIRETRAKDPRLLAVVHAGTLGLLAAPSGSPLPAASALAPGSADEVADEHTIRVLCRAVPTEARQGGADPPAK